MEASFLNEGSSEHPHSASSLLSAFDCSTSTPGQPLKCLYVLSMALWVICCAEVTHLMLGPENPQRVGYLCHLNHGTLRVMMSFQFTPNSGLITISHSMTDSLSTSLNHTHPGSSLNNSEWLGGSPNKILISMGKCSSNSQY